MTNADAILATDRAVRSACPMGTATFMGEVSSGLFSRVYFFHTAREGLRTYTRRHRREDGSGVKLHEISSECCGGPRFGELFIDTAWLKH